MTTQDPALRPTAADPVAPPAAPMHARMSHWPVVDDCLVVGGMPLTRLAQRVGRTPFYAYDRRLITERVGLLRQHLPSAIKLHYAMKANPMPALVGHVAQLVDGLDVASGGELKVALDAGADAREDQLRRAGQERSRARAGGGRRHPPQRRVDARDRSAGPAVARDVRGRASPCASIRISSSSSPG